MDSNRGGPAGGPSPLPAPQMPPPQPSKELPVLRKLKQYETVQLPTPEQLQAQAVWDSCPMRGVTSLVLGGAMGAVFGAAFGASDPSPAAAAADAEAQTLAQSVRAAFKPAVMREAFANLRSRSWSYAKAFAGFGAVYASSECVIESFRAKHDWKNSLGAGCFTGGAMAARAGPTAMCFGCASIGAFSVLIDSFLEK